MQHMCRVYTFHKILNPYPSSTAALPEPLARPCRISPTVEHGIDQYQISIDLVVNGKRKTFRQQAMVYSEAKRVYSGVDQQRFNIGKKRVQKVLPQPGFLHLVEAEAVNQAASRILIFTRILS